MSFEIDNVIKGVSVQVKLDIILIHKASDDEDTHAKYRVEVITENGEIISANWWNEVGADHYHPTNEPMWFAATHTYLELVKEAQDV